MKYFSMFLLSVILLTSCKSPTCTCPTGDAPSLKVTNSACGNILSVSLVGYDFQNLAIAENESKTFTLSDGIPAGLDNVNVNVTASYRNRGFNGDISVDFMSGQVASIKIVQTQFTASCDMRYVELQLDE